MRRLVLGAVIAAAAVSLAALVVLRPDGARSAEPQPRTLTVVGSGSAETVPDTAGFSFGVLTRAATASAAQSANTAAASKLVDALKQAGVAAADLRTEQVSLQPRYDDKGEKILGYEAQNTVSATVRGVQRAGAVVDAAVAAGAGQVSGPTLTSAARDALYRQALAAAYADAKAKADTLAAKAGATAGPAVQMSEQGASQPQPLAASRAADVGQKIEPGTEEIDAQLTVTFALG
jgi:uncharacterized protein YggE